MTGQPEGQAGLSSEIDAGLSAIWSRYVGERPSDTAVELESEVVRWTIPGGIAKFDDGLNGETPTTSPSGRTNTVAGYNRETTKVVSTATRRAVNARISKRDKKSGDLTEVFILDAMHVRY